MAKPCYPHGELISSTMNVERTAILLKPDTLQRDLVGEIINRFERKGLKIVGMKLAPLSGELLDEHYSHVADKPFYPPMREFMSHIPVVAMVLEGLNAVNEVRKIVGSTNPQEADAGTIRADYSMTMPSNVVHASSSLEDAEDEIKRFFNEDELYSYEKMTDRFIFRDGV